MTAPSKIRLKIFKGISSQDLQKWREAVQEALEETSQILYFTPTKLRKRLIREDLFENRSVYQGDRVWTLQEFLEKRSLALHSLLSPSHKVIGKLPAQLLLDEVIGKLEEFHGTGHSGLSRRFLQLLMEVKESTIEDLSNPLEAFLSQLEDQEGKESFRRRVFREYDKLLKKYELLDSADLLLLMAREIEKNPSQREHLIGDAEILILDGFYFLKPLEEHFLKTMMEGTKRTLAYIPLAREAFSEKEETFALPRRTLQFFLGMDLPLEDVPEAKENLHSFGRLFGGEDLMQEKLSSPRIVYEEAENPFEEVLSIALKVKKLLLQNVPPSDILVTFPSYHSYSPLVEEIFPLMEIPHVLTLGSPVNRVPLIQTILSLLELPLGNFNPQKVLDVLNSPYIRWKGKEGEAGGYLRASDVERMVQIGRIVGKGLDEWQDRMKKGEGLLDHSPYKMEPEIYRRSRKALLDLLESIPQWSEVLSLEEIRSKLTYLLEKLALPRPVWDEALLLHHPHLLQRDYRGWNKFKTTLEEIFWTFEEIKKDRVYGEEFLSIFREKLREIPLPGEFLDPYQVSVLGLLDTRGLQFSHVFLGGFTEGDFPKYPEYDVLISAEERSRLGWASPSLRSLAEEKLLFILLLQSTRKTIVFSCPKNRDESPTLPSPFLENLREIAHLKEVPFVPPGPKESFSAFTPYFQDLWLGQLISQGQDTPSGILSKLKSFYREAPNLSQRLHAIRVSSHRDDLKSLSLYEGVVENKKIQKKIHSSFSIFSPSQLETYAKCGFRFFHERALRLRTIEEVKEEITPQERGILIHEILFGFYQQWKEKYPREKVSESRREEAEEIILKSALEIFEHPVWASLSGIPWQIYKEQLIGGLAGKKGPGLLKEFLKEEIKSSNFPQYFEWSFGYFEKLTPEAIDQGSTDENLILDSQGKPALLPFPDLSIKIRGKVDRIDFIQGKGEKIPLSLEVCDYKTGHFPTKKDLEKGTAYQLSLYLLAAEQLLPKQEGPFEPAQGAYYKLNKLSDIKKTYLIKPKDVDFSLSLVERNVLEDQKALAAGYFPRITDPAALNPPGGYCLHCPAFLICSPNPSSALQIWDPLQRLVLNRKEKILEEMEEKKKG